MRYYIISDTHFNHKQMVEYCGRPENFNEIIWKNLEQLNDNDILIHLGDICIGGNKEVHERLSKFKFKKILVKGNHDHKSNTWYLEHGWDFVCEEFKDTLYGYNIVFSHKPVVWDVQYDINIHGHFHNSKQEPKNKYQELYSPELQDYKPVELEKFINNIDPMKDIREDEYFKKLKRRSTRKIKLAVFLYKYFNITI
jgi:calcineurin-like phosphoesterase family protein